MEYDYQRRGLDTLRTHLRSLFLLLLSGSLALGTGCTAGSTVPTATASPKTVPSVTSSPAPGARAAKIILQTSTSGSFDAPTSATGTAAAVGSGLQIARVFNPDGSLLSVAGGASWPPWLASFELGISGTSNASALNADCARFADSTESAANNCKLGGSATLTTCGASAGQYRVSEADCSLQNASIPPASTGSGGPADGVYMRAGFNRANLASTENILVVIEYASSALNPAPANPTACFSGGQLLPESCSDFVWRAYLKHSAAEIAQSFFLLVPPTFVSVASASLTSGTNIATRQFVLPLAGDQLLSFLQISRVSSNFPTPTATNALMAACTGGVLPADSPLCVGMVFISMTLFRI